MCDNRSLINVQILLVNIPLEYEMAAVRKFSLAFGNRYLKFYIRMHYVFCVKYCLKISSYRHGESPNLLGKIRGILLTQNN